MPETSLPQELWPALQPAQNLDTEERRLGRPGANSRMHC
jgi:hypothetical protein